MASMSKVFLIGNLTRDPELKYTPGGAAVCEFAMAINRAYTNKQTNQKVEEVSFIDCTAWAKTAELVAQYLKKGSQAHVEGRLQQDRWEDKNNGQKRSKIRVVAERVIFLGGKGSGGNAQPEAQPAETAPGEDIPF